MSWWGWVIAGAILLGAELTLVSAEFYFVFVGIAAIIVGCVTAMAPAFRGWEQWALFGFLAVVSMVIFRSRVYRRFRGHSQAVNSGPVGDVITLLAPLAPGESCRTEYRGTSWTVRNEGPAAVPAGARVPVASVQGLTLIIRSD